MVIVFAPFSFWTNQASLLALVHPPWQSCCPTKLLASSVEGPRNWQHLMTASAAHKCFMAKARTKSGPARQSPHSSVSTPNLRNLGERWAMSYLLIRLIRFPPHYCLSNLLLVNEEALKHIWNTHRVCSFLKWGSPNRSPETKPF